MLLHTLLPVVPSEGEAAVVKVMVAHAPAGLPCLVRASRLDDERRAFVLEKVDQEATIFRRYFENAPVGMTESSIDGRFVRVNQRFCEITGYTEEELLALRFQEITHADDLAPELGLLQKTLTGQQTGYTFEKRLLMKRGDYVWVQRRVTLQRTADGAPDFLLSVVVDITARKMAERALQRSSAQLAAAQRVARIGNWELDLGTGTLLWSDEIFRIFELDPGAFRASYDAFLDRVHPDDRARVDAAYRASVDNHTPYFVTHRLVMPDGRVKHVQEVGETFYGDQGKPLRSVGTVQDVTEQKSTQQGLRDREARLSTILTTIRDMVTLFQVQGDAVRVIEINPTGFERFRWFLPDLTLEKLAATDFRELATVLAPRAPSVTQFCDLLFEAVATGQPRRIEVESRPEPGVVLHSDVTVSPVPNDGNLPNLVLSVSRDVTESRKAEQLLRASLAEKETLLSEVHHRVKNNLQVISSLLSLQAGQTSDDGVRAALGDSGRRIQTMAMVHERLYRSARLSSIDLGAHLAELARMVFDSTRRRGITLDCDTQSIDVDLDIALPLGLMLNELVSNACKHAFRERDGGRVSVTLRRTGERVELVVADDGVGLPAGFEVEQCRSLGLRIVVALARQLRATLSVEREHGTRVAVVVREAR